MPVHVVHQVRWMGAKYSESSCGSSKAAEAVDNRRTMSRAPIIAPRPQLTQAQRTQRPDPLRDLTSVTQTPFISKSARARGTKGSQEEAGTGRKGKRGAVADSSHISCRTSCDQLSDSLSKCRTSASLSSRQRMRKTTGIRLNLSQPLDTSGAKSVLLYSS